MSIDDAAGAALNRGDLLLERGDVAGARAAYERALDSGDPDRAPRAAVKLGVLLAREGDAAGARAAFERAIESGHPDQAPKGQNNLGVLLAERGDVAGARAVYERAIDSGHADEAPRATCNLADLVARYGDSAGARAAYERVIDSGHPNEAPRAAVGLGLLLAREGDVAGARQAYERAIESGHPEHAPKGANNLGVMLAGRGDVARARAAYERAIDSGHPDLAPTAANNLGVMLAERGEAAGARAAYERAIDSGHSDQAPKGANSLAFMLRQRGDLEGARAFYEQASASGHHDEAPAAMYNLGDVLARQGDLAAARAAYERAIDSGHAAQAPRAAVGLGNLLGEQGDLAAARIAYERAIDFGHSHLSLSGANKLGNLLKAEGDAAGARAAWKRAIDSEQPIELSPQREWYLGHATALASDSTIERIVRERVERWRCGGIVTGVIDPDGTTRVIAYGDPGRGQPPLGADSVFEIGSITKTFTATVLADMVGRGEVGLEERVADLLPDAVEVPQRGGLQIELLDLATHTSGLPRLPTNLRPRDPANPYADYTVTQLYKFLSGHTLARDIGSQFEYSNLGAGLLGHALARRADKSYAELARERTLDPLGMAMTSTTPTPEMQQHFALPHNHLGRAVARWELPTLAGAGGLCSTAPDMLRFAAANLDSDCDQPRPAIVATHLPRFSVGRTMRIGLGWHILRALDFDILTHSGGTGGSRSFIGLDKARHTAVVVLANSVFDIDDLGFHLLDDRHPLVPPSEVSLVPAALKRHLGASRRWIDRTLRRRQP